MQRSANDPSLLVAIYEGQHNHHPSGAEISSPGGCSGSAANLDLRDPITCSKIQTAIAETEDTEIQKLFVEKMASSLTRNHSFTAALVAAITGRILDDVSDDSLSN